MMALRIFLEMKDILGERQVIWMLVGDIFNGFLYCYTNRMEQAKQIFH